MFRNSFTNPHQQDGLCIARALVTAVVTAAFYTTSVAAEPVMGVVRKLVDENMLVAGFFKEAKPTTYFLESAPGYKEHDLGMIAVMKAINPEWKGSMLYQLKSGHAEHGLDAYVGLYVLVDVVESEQGFPPLATNYRISIVNHNRCRVPKHIFVATPFDSRLDKASKRQQVAAFELAHGRDIDSRFDKAVSRLSESISHYNLQRLEIDPHPKSPITYIPIDVANVPPPFYLIEDATGPLTIGVDLTQLTEQRRNTALGGWPAGKPEDDLIVWVVGGIRGQDEEEDTEEEDAEEVTYKRSGEAFASYGWMLISAHTRPPRSITIAHELGHHFGLDHKYAVDGKLDKTNLMIPKPKWRLSFLLDKNQAFRISSAICGSEALRFKNYGVVPVNGYDGKPRCGNGLVGLDEAGNVEFGELGPIPDYRPRRGDSALGVLCPNLQSTGRVMFSHVAETLDCRC